jgi:hypothetical protein
MLNLFDALDPRWINKLDGLPSSMVYQARWFTKLDGLPSSMVYQARWFTKMDIQLPCLKPLWI